MKKVFLSIFFAIIILFIPSTVFAKDYSIPTANFDVQIQKDGSANVTETRTYDFSGSYSWADEWILKKEFRITNYELSEGNKKYAENATGLPGTFSVQDEGNRIYIKWNYSATDEEKTFTLSYKVENAVTNQKDISEFYWQLIGDQWTKGVDAVTAKIHLAYPAPDSQIWAFGHGPLNGKISIVSNQEIDFIANDLPPKTFFEIRVLFPKNSSFINAQTGTKTLSSILSEEKGFGNQTRIKALIFPAIFLLIVLLSIWRLISWVKTLRKVGFQKKPPEPNIAGTLHEPPGNLAPALVESLTSFGYQPSGKSIVATIIELTRRKILRIEFVKDGAKTLFGRKDQYFLEILKKDKKSMSFLEEKVVDFLFPDSSKKVDFEDIKNYGRTRQMEAYEFWKDFKSSSKDELVGGKYLSQENLDIQSRGMIEGFVSLVILVVF